MKYTFQTYRGMNVFHLLKEVEGKTIYEAETLCGHRSWGFKVVENELSPTQYSELSNRKFCSYCARLVIKLGLDVEPKVDVVAVLDSALALLTILRSKNPYFMDSDQWWDYDSDHAGAIGDLKKVRAYHG